MSYSEDYRGSYIDSFRIDGKRYEHTIHCNTDDRVECKDEAGKVVLTFTACCDVHIGNKKGPQLGRFNTYADGTWYFVYGQDAEKVLDSGTRDLLKFEVEISKLYLQGKL